MGLMIRARNDHALGLLVGGLKDESRFAGFRGRWREVYCGVFCAPIELIRRHCRIPDTARALPGSRPGSRPGDRLLGSDCRETGGG